ncbi:OsmC/Ohr family [Gloeopeniophorella convolvens]|nr:OsmC/Ohr family [Gloeopeniophorella convolvens]
MSTLARNMILRGALRSNASPLLLRVPARRTLITLKDSLYQVSATSQGGRDGRVTSTPPKGTALDFKLASPGSGAEGYNPEQLFAAGYSACFFSAIKAAAAQQGKKEAAEQAVVHADVTIGKATDRGGYGLSVVLRIEGVEDQAIIDAAHEMCPYSRVLREGAVVEVKKV